jgi:hypothetical protein
MGPAAIHAGGNVVIAVLGVFTAAIYGWWLARLLARERRDPVWVVLFGIILVAATMSAQSLVVAVSPILNDGVVRVFKRSMLPSLAFWTATRIGLISSLVFLLCGFAACMPGMTRTRVIDIGRVIGVCAVSSWVLLAFVMW